jgi:hypothetical protein
MKITFAALPAQGKNPAKCLRFRDILTNTCSLGTAQCARPGIRFYGYPQSQQVAPHA